MRDVKEDLDALDYDAAIIPLAERKNDRQKRAAYNGDLFLISNGDQAIELYPEEAERLAVWLRCQLDRLSF
jgi:hypothetical protein